MANKKPNLIQLARRSSSPEELVRLASGERLLLSAEDADIYFSRWHEPCELEDEELDEAVGGLTDSSLTNIVCEVCGEPVMLPVNADAKGQYFCAKCRCLRKGKAI